MTLLESHFTDKEVKAEIGSTFNKITSQAYTVLCDSISGEMRKEKCLLIPETTTDQSKDITKVQLSERMHFIGISYKNMHEGF